MTTDTTTNEAEPQTETVNAAEQSVESLLPSAPTKPMMMSGKQGLIIRDIGEMWQLSGIFHNSGLAPASLDTREKVFVALQMGAELGLTPMQSLNNIAVVNGRPTVWGDVPLALCMQSGLFDQTVFEELIEQDEGDGMVAICRVRRKPHGKVVERRFSMKDARHAKLLEKNTPWQTYPRRMVQLRARSFALRDTFADVLSGVPIGEEYIGVGDPQTIVVDQSRSQGLANRLKVQQESTGEPPAPDAVDEKPKRRKGTTANVDPPADDAPNDAPNDPSGEPTADFVAFTDFQQALEAARDVEEFNAAKWGIQAARNSGTITAEQFESLVGESKRLAGRFVDK